MRSCHVCARISECNSGAIVLLLLLLCRALAHQTQAHQVRTITAAAAAVVGVEKPFGMLGFNGMCVCAQCACVWEITRLSFNAKSVTEPDTMRALAHENDRAGGVVNENVSVHTFHARVLCTCFVYVRYAAVVVGCQ